MIKPLFSIITVTKNNLSGLKKTYQSITCQNPDIYEWIVIDGGSNDGTKDFLTSTYTHWISEPDNGIYDAMNKGIKASNGEYLIFMNAGDCFVNNETLTLIKNATRSNPDFIYGDATEGKNYKKARPHKKIRQGMITHHQSMIYRAPVPDYNLNFQIASDYDLTLKILNRANNIYYIPEPLSLFESGGLSQTHVTQGRKEQFLVRKKYGISYIENILIYSLQTLLYQLRRFMPSAYWLLKKH